MAEFGVLRTLRVIQSDYPGSNVIVLDATWQEQSGSSEWNSIFSVIHRKTLAGSRIQFVPNQGPTVSDYNRDSQAMQFENTLGKNTLMQFYSIKAGLNGLESYIGLKELRPNDRDPILTIRSDVFCVSGFSLKKNEDVSVSDFRHRGFDDNLVVTSWRSRFSLDVFKWTKPSDFVGSTSPEDVRASIATVLQLNVGRRTQMYVIFRSLSRIQLALNLSIACLQWTSRLLLPKLYPYIWSPKSMIYAKFLKRIQR